MLLKKVNLIAPSSYQETLCDKFSNEVSHKRDNRKFYGTKGEWSFYKLKQWAYLGKMAEFAVFNTMIINDKYNFISPPDIMIYDSKRKSHAADIVVDERNIHVKSFVSEEGRAPSWLFSTEDKLVTSPSALDIVALVTITLPKKFEAYFIPAVDLIGKYEAPFNAKTIAHAIYEETLLRED